MKTFPIGIMVLFTLQAGAQYDAWVDQPFKNQVLIIDSICQAYAHSNDSIGFMAVLKKLTSLAKTKKETELTLLTEYARFNYLVEKNINQPDLVLSSYTHLKQKSLQHKNIRIAALVERKMAFYYWVKAENYEWAFEHYFKGYELLKQLSANIYPFRQVDLYTLGEKYYFFNDYPNAILYLHKALAEKNGDDPTFPISINNTMALSFQGMDQIDSSNHYFFAALEIAEKTNSTFWIGNLTGNIGGNFLRTGNEDEAEKWLRKDVEISLFTKNKGSAAGALMMIATINLNKGNTKLAFAQVDSCKILLNDSSSPTRRKTLYPLLSKMAAYNGDWKLAAAYLDSTLTVRDQIEKKVNASKLLRAQQKADIQQHRAEMQKVENERRIKTMERNATATGLFLSILGALVLFRQIKRTRKAKKRSDELLLNILPENVADELKEFGTSKAKRFENVTVLFSDFVSFTQHAEALSAEELVALLDYYFTAFDQIITSLGLEKIKTVGDAYICVGGLPEANAAHAEKVVRAALKQQDVMAQHPAGWNIRIGIHSGSVVAGIVGSKKFAYDIWGDTVNTASRMESHGAPGKINISRATYELLKNNPAFIFENRGKVDTKGKGEMEMWFVDGKD